MTEVQHYFMTRKLRLAANHTFIALIPKFTTATKVEQYRPIALCNVYFKVITKIIPTRLRYMLACIIHPSQSAFIPQCYLNDNIIINHEIMYYLNKKRGKTSYMATKIDIAKAYDRLEWSNLINVLIKLGFSTEFVKLVHSCISTVRFSILLNGAPFGYFKGGRGIREGDPMSPALFTVIFGYTFSYFDPCRTRWKDKWCGSFSSKPEDNASHTRMTW